MTSCATISFSSFSREFSQADPQLSEMELEAARRRKMIIDHIESAYNGAIHFGGECNAKLREREGKY